MLNETNKLVVYNPRKPHLSELFSGTRYAITYSYNPSIKELNASDRMRALSLGFNLNPSVGNLVIPGRSAAGTQDVDPLVAGPGTKHHMVPPENTAQAVETIDPLLPTTLRYPEKNFRFRVIKNLPKVKRQAYAGGTMRSHKLLGEHETNHSPQSEWTNA